MSVVEKLRASALVIGKFLLIVAAGIALAGALLLALFHFVDRHNRMCRTLKPGVTRVDLERTLGPPVRRDADWLYFQGNSWADDAMIRARVREADGRVTELRCLNNHVTWKDSVGPASRAPE